jgi:ribosomal protein S12 methylthiotransferase
MADIVSEAEALAASGARELILIAQDTTYYGRDLGGDGLPELLRELCGIDGLWKLRLLYAYPERVDDKLIEAMAASPRVARYIDIPMQHSDAAILRRMGRPGSGEKLLALLGRLRAAMPDITVRSSFIVGFPGETETQFKGLLDFLDEARLGRAGCFAFSPEEGTPAAKLPGRISAGVKRKRAERFMQRQDAVMARSLESMARRKMEVICDGFDEGAGMFACRGEADAPEIDTCVYLPPESGLVPGEIYSVSITGTNGADLYAELA